jgi:retron-type reverse transcriptase
LSGGGGLKGGFWFESIIAVENLLGAWREFVKGKRQKPDVQEFSFKLMDNILQLHQDLKSKTYRHGPYQHFRINDPKPRDIHKALVRDRVLHHAIYRQLYWFFHQRFIPDSFSCQRWKGTHKALDRFRTLAHRVGQNHTRSVWILKCDVKKFFASVDQKILLEILGRWLAEPDLLWLLERVIGSFNSGQSDIGLPLGNLTSQLLVNIYLNEFDQFVKRELKAKHYIRYADDFVILSTNKPHLFNLIPILADFLEIKLHLQLHPRKVSIRTLASGVDFLGWVHFPDHRALRTATKRRMFRKVKESPKAETLNSYLGMLEWGNGYKLRQKLLQLRREVYLHRR